MNHRKLFTLDLVRAVSTILIVIFHYNIQLGLHGIGGGPIFIQNIQHENIGSLGISLFIILSGAGLMYSNYEKLDHPLFYKNRAKNIFPIYYLCYFFTFLVLFYTNGTIPVRNSLLTFPLTLLGMDGFLYELIPNLYLCGEWFVGFILLFYLAFPLLRKFVLTGKRETKIAVYSGYMLLMIIFTRTNLIYSVIPMDPTRNPLVRLPDFVFGMEWAKRERMQEQDETRMPPSTFIMMLLLFLVFTFAPLPVGHPLIAFVCGSSLFMILYALAEVSEKKNRIYQSVVSAVSKYSFAVILTHHNVIALLISKFDGRDDLGALGLYALFFYCVIVIGVASFWLQRISKKILSF